MGVIQSGINRVLGSLAGASVAYQKYTGKGMLGSRLADRQDKANSKVEEVQEAKQKQRRVFKKYLANEPTSLGGTVGDLPPAMQKQIAAQYSKSERKALMDRVDREANRRGTKK